MPRRYGMLLSELTKGIEHELFGKDAEINKIEYDSRKVEKGDLFSCVVGTFRDGHVYAQSAVERGAAALLVEKRLPIEITQIVVSDTRKAMAMMAANYYGHPERELKLVGVTGTNGKTSTTYMIKAIAEESGIKTGIIGTIHNMIGDRSVHADRTTPESVDLFKLLRMMCDEGVTLAIMEVSSHSLDQRRVYGLEFDTSVFTNLTQDHLDYHKTIENYFAAKKKLFYHTRNAVINVDDMYGERIVEGTQCSVSTFAIGKEADVMASEIEFTTDSVSFFVKTPKWAHRVYVPIPGLFTVFNAIGSICAAQALGFSMEATVNGLANMHRVEGRLEPLPVNGHDFSVYLDFAHTPDAVQNVLTAVQSFAKGRIVTLFGCGGDRDKAKRPIMGEIAGRFSDFLIVSSDNPRTEDPMAIIENVLEGVKRSGCPYVIIENRREAIRYALEHAKSNDCIVLAGKGHENYQEINGVKHHFDEKEVVAELLSEIFA